MPLTLDSYDKDKHADALRPGLRLNPMDGTGAKISDEETDAVIRDILSGEAKAAPIPRGSARRMALPEVVDQEELVQRRPRRRPARPVAAEPVPTAPAPGAAPREEPAPEMVANGIYAEGFEAVEPAREASAEPEAAPGKGRPWVRPALFGAILAAAVLRPWLVLLPLFLGFWAVMITVAVLGGGSFGDGFGRVYRWLKGRNPARAERMRARMDRIAMRWDSILDRMPGRWAESLALPDFSDDVLDPQVGAGRPDPFERLA